MLKYNKIYLRNDNQKLNIPFYKGMNFKEQADKLGQKTREYIINCMKERQMNNENQAVIENKVVAKVVDILNDLL